MGRIGGGERVFRWDSCEKNENYEMIAINIPDHVFGFLDEESQAGEDKLDNQLNQLNQLNQEEGDNPSSENNFWETQNHLLQATLCRTSSLESKIRNITKQALKQQDQQQQICICSGNKQLCTNSCLMKQICLTLQNSNFNSAICKSKWNSSPTIASGEHTFLDVLDNTNTKRGQVRVIIELNFRAEFQMARASEEYKDLINKLPEIFVGKTDRLLSLIKILCCAAKKCMKDKKLHLGPWRKQPYMQAKWFNVSERTTALPPPLLLSTATRSNQNQNQTQDQVLRPGRTTRSMLTVDLLENLPINVHTTVVAVL